MALACGGPTKPPPESESNQPISPAKADDSVPRSHVSQTRTRLRLDVSPYGPSLVLLGSRPALVTADALHWLDGDGSLPVPLTSGEQGGMGGTSLTRWSAGVLRRFDPARAGWAVLGRMPRAPRLVVDAGDGVAWLRQNEPNAGVSLWALVGSEPRRVAAVSGDIGAMTLRDDRLFFVEELPGSSWRLGVVATSGDGPRYAEPVRGRTPAMLAVTSDVFYYDGPTLSVYRVSTDLKRTEQVGKDVICSPFAVAASIYCSQPGGLLELPLAGGPARVLVPSQGTVTAMLATDSQLFWLREAPRGGLAVESMSLSRSAAPR
ncbi:MAG: hypothetical protein K0R38_6284 [Polyangiaceae bacterium]|nr:hypothetical protein [Polyangiaceae bacterium]